MISAKTHNSRQRREIHGLFKPDYEAGYLTFPRNALPY